MKKNITYKFNKFFTLLFHILKLNRIVYHIFAHSDFMNIDDTHANISKCRLNELSYNPCTSCLTNNNIEKKFDLHFIVPAYNVENYIEQCVDSIITSQKKYSYYVTIVNDGSTDRTKDVLKKYERIENVNIIHQSNKGFSGARNSALKKIVGKYIMFVDSDDYVEWDGIEKMLDCAFKNNADIVQGSIMTITSNKNKKIYKIQKNEDISLQKEKLLGQPWGKVFKADVFYNICFPEKYWYEDSINAQILFPMSEKVFSVADIVYFYRKNKSSITYSSEISLKAIDSLWITLALYSDRICMGLKDTQTYYEYLIRQSKVIYSRTQYLDINIRKDIFIVYANWLKDNFGNFKTEKEENRQIDNAIKNGDFGVFSAFCKWM